MRSVVSTISHESGCDSEVGVVDEEEGHLIDDLHERDGALLRDPHGLRGDLDVERGPEPLPGERLALASQLVAVEAADPFTVEPVELRPVEAGGRVGDPVDVELCRRARPRRGPRCRRRRAPIRATRGS